MAAQLLRSEAGWDSIAGDRLTTYVAGEANRNRGRVLHATTRDAIDHALSILDEAEMPAHVRVFFVQSREEMQRAVGSKATGVAEAPAAAAILVASDTWSPFVRHEIMHLVSLHLWLQPGHEVGTVIEGNQLWRRGGWLREGLAAYAEDRCGSHTNRQVAAAQLRAGDLLPVRDLQARFYDLPDAAAYLQAGSLAQFVLERYGRESFRELWDTLSVEESLGVSPGQLHDGWAAWLEETSPPLPDLQALAARGCG